MAESDDLELIKGTLDLLILQTLGWGPRHGYAIAKWIQESSREELVVEDRALYVALHRLEARKLVRGRWRINDTGRRAKFYELTPAGQADLQSRQSRWARYVRAVSSVMRVTPASEPR